jgi:hypothetical protein
MTNRCVINAVFLPITQSALLAARHTVSILKHCVSDLAFGLSGHDQFSESKTDFSDWPDINIHKSAHGIKAKPIWILLNRS